MLLRAPAKLNLCLYLGGRREDGLHGLCSLFEPLALADLIEVAPAERDEVICPGVEGENLAMRALAGLRERGWEHEPLRVEIDKRVPVAASWMAVTPAAAATCPMRTSVSRNSSWLSRGRCPTAGAMAPNSPSTPSSRPSARP